MKKVGNHVSCRLSVLLQWKDSMYRMKHETENPLLHSVYVSTENDRFRYIYLILRVHWTPIDYLNKRSFGGWKSPVQIGERNKFLPLFLCTLVLSLTQWVGFSCMPQEKPFCCSDVTSEAWYFTVRTIPTVSGEWRILSYVD